MRAAPQYILVGRHRGTPLSSMNIAFSIKPAPETSRWEAAGGRTQELPLPKRFPERGGQIMVRKLFPLTSTLVLGGCVAWGQAAVGSASAGSAGAGQSAAGAGPGFAEQHYMDHSQPASCGHDRCGRNSQSQCLGITRLWHITAINHTACNRNPAVCCSQDPIRI